MLSTEWLVESALNVEPPLAPYHRPCLADDNPPPMALLDGGLVSCESPGTPVRSLVGERSRSSVPMKSDHAAASVCSGIPKSFLPAAQKPTILELLRDEKSPPTVACLPPGASGISTRSVF